MFLDGVRPYALAPAEKAAYLADRLGPLLEHHERRCPAYARLVGDWRRHRREGPVAADDYPCLPVGLFKEADLRSTSDPVVQVSSSATTSGSPARIFVDKETRKRQTLSAARIWSDFIGTEQRPYLVFDDEATVRGGGALSARGAAILSLMHHARGFHFVCPERDGEPRLDRAALAAALDAIGGRPFIAYGFTWVLYRAHRELAAGGGAPARAHPDSVLIHSGGWKRLEREAVDKRAFGEAVASPWGLAPGRVIDFYGSVEQVGIPYPDCREGRKHVPYWAEVVVRRADSFEPCPPGETGLLQLVSCLPLSAPNQSVLSEDLGERIALDGCPCGRRGSAFVFRGRAPRAELRGCSDVARR